MDTAPLPEIPSLRAGLISTRRAESDRKWETMETVCVFFSDDEIEIELVRAELERNGIPVMVKNLYTQNLFSGIKLFTGHDAIAGSMQIWVREDHAERSLEILQAGEPDGVEEPAAENAHEEEHDSDETVPPRAAARQEQDDTRKAVYAAVLLTCLSFLVVPFLINIAVLVGLSRTRRKASIMLGILSGLLAIAGFFFILRTAIVG